MKAILKFNLPEEYVEYTTCNNAGNLASIIFEYDQKLRNMYKYENKETISTEEARDLLREIMDENDLTFNSTIFS